MSNTTPPKDANYSIPIIVTIAASFLVVAGLCTALIITGHDPSSFLNVIITLIGLLPSIGVIGYAVTQASKKTDTVLKNTNGNLSKLQSQNQALTAVATPEQIVTANSSLMPESHFPVNPVAVTAAAESAPTLSNPDPIPSVPAEVQFTPITPINVTSGSSATGQ